MGWTKAALLLSAVLVPGCTVNQAQPARAPERSAAAAAPKLPAAADAVTGDAAVAQLKRLGRYDSLQQAVTAARYEVRRDERRVTPGVTPVYRAGNPRQRLTASFDGEGVHLAPDAQGTDTPAWQTSLRFVGYGRDDLQPAGTAVVSATDNRVESRWDGPVTEWFVNRPDGLEHGFTIAARPEPSSPEARLRLAMRVAGDLRAEVRDSGQALALLDGNGQLALRYAGLHAYDADGRTLPARMSARDGLVQFEVDDRQAVYPVTVDPIFTQQAKLLASDGLAGDSFGSAVAIYSNTVVIGAPYDDVDGNTDEGSAYVFAYSDGSWFEQAKLTSLHGHAGDAFGYSVAIYWDTIVVGSPTAQQTLPPGGAAIVFTRTGSAWSQQKLLRPSDAAAGDRFGESVSISGGTIAVGASQRSGAGGAAYQGAAYVFTGSGAAWSQQAKLVANDGAAANFFGIAVAIGTNTIAVGAHYATVGSNSRQGAAYVFVRSGTTWSQQAKLTASDGAAADVFGRSIAINGIGTRIVVGAPDADVGGRANQGAAYVFIRPSPPFWGQQAKLTAFDGAANDAFGSAVAVSGYEVVVGAPKALIWAGVPDQGAAYDFICNSVCSAAVKMTAPSGAAGDRFGAAVAVLTGISSTVIVGSPADDNGSNTNQGSASVMVR